MILGCSDDEDGLDMAREAVRIAELGLKSCSNPGELEEQLLADCCTVLTEVQAYRAEDEEDEDQDELVWESAAESTSTSSRADEHFTTLQAVPANTGGAASHGGGALASEPSAAAAPATARPPRRTIPQHMSEEDYDAAVARSWAA